MDFKQIQELIKMINKSNIGEVTIEEKDFKVTVKQKEDPVAQVIQAPAYTQLPQAQISQAQAPAQALPSISPASTSASEENFVTIKSPMIGTFYKKAGPGKPNYVEIGDEVSEGKVVCIIEAMKLFNEIESEVKGKIVKILVEDSDPVEYDQPLFLIDPS